MKQELVKSPIGELEIRQRIKTIRGVQVMLDWDIAELYGVETRSLNQAVKRNKERFPLNFRFQLTKNELSELITDCDKSDRKRHYPGTPAAFTEQGIAMLSAVLRSPTAIKVSIKIMEAFVALRHAFLSSAGILQRLGNVEVKLIETDKRLDMVFDALDRSKLLPCGILPANSSTPTTSMTAIF